MNDKKLGKLRFLQVKIVYLRFCRHLTSKNGSAHFSGGEMQNIAECKPFFIQINLGLSEAATQGPAVGARRARKMATSKRA